LPVVEDNQLKKDDKKLGKWQIGHLISLRHYFLHGSKKEKDEKGKILPIPDIISYELPEFIIQNAEQAILDYWKCLKEDKGGEGGWVDRLARADIQPLKLQGSEYEKGLVDPDIVDCLEEKANLLN